MNFLLLYVFVLFVISAFCMKRKYVHPVDDDQYSVLAKLAKGSFMKPVTEKSKTGKSTIVKFEIEDGALTDYGKKVSLAITSF